MNELLPVIGIDFGTSNSKMAWYNPKTGQAEILKNDEGIFFKTRFKIVNK